ncbi:Uncharacterised protein [Brucella abortus]|nr:Uncharacterised protein [Brucella abortus]
MSDGVNRFLGDTPGRILVKLVLISLVVGVVMSAFYWTPYDILYGIRDFFLHLWNMGFSAVARFADYLVLGQRWSSLPLFCSVSSAIVNERNFSDTSDTVSQCSKNMEFACPGGAFSCSPGVQWRSLPCRWIGRRPQVITTQPQSSTLSARQTACP